jgi:hypothetical protein
MREERAMDALIRHLDDEIVKCPRLDAGQHRHLRAAFDLEGPSVDHRVFLASVIGGAFSPDSPDDTVFCGAMS